MTHRASQSQTSAAAKAGISERSARRIDQQDLQPAKNNRKWRTRTDPLSLVWDNVVLPLLKSCNEIAPVGIFDHLCECHSDKFNPSARRTLERRILKWRQLYGQSQTVIFVQEHHPGALGICDFTHADFPETIAVIVKLVVAIIYNTALISGSFLSGFRCTLSGSSQFRGFPLQRPGVFSLAS